jgi:hypothetical protein
MPTATTSPKRSTAKAKAGAKPARAKAAATRSTTRKTKPTRAKATRAKASRTRAAHQTQAAAKQSQTATRDTAQVVGDYAERAVLIQVGAALYARDRVVSTVSDTISTYTSSSKAQKELQQRLRRFERRGITARRRLEREVRKARVRVERELRQRRRAIERTVSDLDGRRDSFAKNGSDLASRVPEIADRVQERILSLV